MDWTGSRGNPPSPVLFPCPTNSYNASSPKLTRGPVARSLVVTDWNVPIGGSAALATSLSLLERAKANDRSAWDRIVCLYAPLVYRWCRRFGLQEADALDVGQDVLRSV